MLTQLFAIHTLLFSTPANAIDIAVVDVTAPGETPLAVHLNDVVYAADADLNFVQIEVGATNTTANPAAVLGVVDVVLLSPDLDEVVNAGPITQDLYNFALGGGRLISSTAALESSEAHAFTWGWFGFARSNGVPGLGFTGAQATGLTPLPEGADLLMGVTSFSPSDVLMAEPSAAAVVPATLAPSGAPALAIAPPMDNWLAPPVATINSVGLYGTDYRPDGWDASTDGYQLLANTIRYMLDNPGPRSRVYIGFPPACPGPIEFYFSGLTPNARFAVVGGDWGYSIASPSLPTAQIPQATARDVISRCSRGPRVCSASAKQTAAGCSPGRARRPTLASARPTSRS